MRIETDDAETSVWLRAMNSKRILLMHLIERKRHRERSMGIATCILWREFFGVSEK